MRRSLLAVLISTALLVSGCGGETASESKSTAESADSKVVPEIIAATAEDLLKVVKDSDGQVVLVNVWATICKPCVEEFPDLVKLRNRYREQGLDLIFVSADFDDMIKDVRKFLVDNGVDFKTYIKTGSDQEFINTLDERWSGAIPFTLIFDKSRKVRYFWEGKASYETLEAKVLDVLE